MMRPPIEWLGRYELIRRLDGEHGDAHLAREGDEERVLTVAALDGQRAEELARQVALCDRLRHPVIVPVHELFAHGDKQVLVFERLAGATLRELGQHLEDQRDNLAPNALCHIGRELASALACAHATTSDCGAIVHARLDPTHVVIGWDGSVRLLGFGAGVLLAGLGPGPFAAPEVRGGGRPNPRANTYSLAAMLWWLAAGRRPPCDGTVPRLAEIDRNLPVEVAEAIDRALAAKPEERTVDCGELTELLAAHAAGGQPELRWNMEVLRAIRDLVADAPPSSEAFPSSSRITAPPSSDDTPTREEALPEVAILQARPPARRPRSKRSTLRSSAEEIIDPCPVRTEEAAGEVIIQSARGRARSASGPPAIENVSDAPPPSEAPTVERDVGELFAEHGVVVPSTHESPHPLETHAPEAPTEDESDSVTKRRSIEDIVAEAAAAESGTTTEESVTELRPVSELAEEHARRAVPADDLAAEPLVPMRVPAESTPPASRGMRASHEPLSSTVKPPRPSSRGRFGVLALATLVAFAAGVVVARFLLSSDARQPAAAGASETTVVPTPSSRPEEQPSASSAVPSTPSTPSTTTPTAGEPTRQGFAPLVVVSTVSDAGVYVFGDYRGPPNEAIAVRCDRTVFVRLGTVPPRHWYTPGRSLFVRCGEVTRVSLEPVLPRPKTQPTAALPDEP
jgi:serine/threonine-protein kinase